MVLTTCVITEIYRCSISWSAEAVMTGGRNVLRSSRALSAFLTSLKNGSPLLPSLLIKRLRAACELHDVLLADRMHHIPDGVDLTRLASMSCAG